MEFLSLKWCDFDDEFKKGIKKGIVLDDEYKNGSRRAYPYQRHQLISTRT